MRKNIIWLMAYSFWFLEIAGCVSAPYTYPPTIEGMPGIYHRVERGQTLWRIAKIYSVDLEELVKINHIYEPSKIESGQMIFIPRTTSTALKPDMSQSLYTIGEDFIWPIKGRVLARFGQNINNIVNQGLDIQAPYGSNVIASRSGIVTFYNEQLKGLGKTIIIDHQDNFLTVYARNSEILVKVGNRVRQGEVIAKVGNAGRDKANYLHFEIRKGHTPQNPYYYLP